MSSSASSFNYEDSAAGLQKQCGVPLIAQYMLGEDYETDHPILAAFWAEEGLEGVRAAVEQDPDVVRRPTEELVGWLPIHWVVYYNPSNRVAEQRPDVARYLLDLYPDSIRERTPHDMDSLLPVHALLLNVDPGLLVDTFRLLVQRWPEALQERTVEGYYPLNLAVCRSVPELVRIVLETWPEAVEVAYKNGSFPLHDAVRHGGDLDAAKQVVEAWPPSIRAVDRKGRIPIHYINKDTDVDVVRFLVRKWRNSVKWKDRYGLLPLHYAASNGREEVVRFLHGRWREGLRVRANDGITPLVAALLNHNARVVRSLVESAPDMVRQVWRDGWLPIHLAMEHYCDDEDVVRLLVEHDPASLRHQTNERMLPLHIAAKFQHYYRNVPVSLIEFLLESFPEAIGMMSKEGWLPVHYAAARGRVPIVQVLVQQFPESIKYGNGDGLTPLNIALSCGEPSLELVRFLVDQEPPSQRAATQIGPFPLHVAATHVMTTTPLEPIVERWPESVGQRDIGWSLPIHLAVARNEPPLALVRFLLDRNPRSVRQTDGRGSLPLHIAVSQAQPSLELVQLLVVRHPPSISQVDGAGSLPLHLAVSQAEPSMEVVELLVDQDVPSLLQPNAGGLLALHVAAAGDAPLEVLYYLARKRPDSIYVPGGWGEGDDEEDRPHEHEHPRPAQRRRLVYKCQLARVAASSWNDDWFRTSSALSLYLFGFIALCTVYSAESTSKDTRINTTRHNRHAPALSSSVVGQISPRSIVALVSFEQTVEMLP